MIDERKDVLKITTGRIGNLLAASEICEIIELNGGNIKPLAFFKGFKVD